MARRKQVRTALKVPPTEHFKQAVLSEAGMGVIKKWVTRCGRFAISSISSKFEATRYLVIEISPDESEGIIDRRKTLRAAVESWEFIISKGRKTA